MSWRSGIDSATLQQRSKIYRTIRRFFDDRGVAEVTTPVLGASGVSDLHIQSLSLVDDGQSWFLQSSPEYSMKRLLASGSGSIYQICPAFRAGELGSKHNTEFSMLEWYRVGYSLEELVAEVATLLQQTLDVSQVQTSEFRFTTYRELFTSRFDVNPHDAGIETLRGLIFAENLTADHIDNIDDDATRNECLDLLFASCIEPGLDEPTFVLEFPAGQAALAKIAANDQYDVVARRFELYWQGMELANGYDELTDPAELRQRFEKNNAQRVARGLIEMAPDKKLLASMSELPDCAGVAIGLDRLVMLLCGKTSIDEVLTFSRQRL
ncbi:EF-P lysine aminoacylase EpmA [Pseudomonadales bacterium]|jgi:lysyl-tRNA synthetase class 2|nr:EF-P lysine aminoacylase GenX [Gammaproteobacteria bacterium]MDC1084654.1 EF-P lysine aminoacylase EpmA [Pseudomonadales bacterium]